MSINFFAREKQLRQEIKTTCVPVTLTVEDMLEVVDILGSGLASHRCESLLKRKIQEAADTALARTLGVE